MKAKDSAAISRAVEDGVKAGIRRFYKHRESRPDDQCARELEDVVAEAVLDEIDTWFTLEDE